MYSRHAIGSCSWQLGCCSESHAFWLFLAKFSKYCWLLESPIPHHPHLWRSTFRQHPKGQSVAESRTLVLRQWPRHTKTGRGHDWLVLELRLDIPWLLTWLHHKSLRPKPMATSMKRAVVFRNSWKFHEISRSWLYGGRWESYIQIYAAFFELYQFIKGPGGSNMIETNEFSHVFTWLPATPSDSVRDCGHCLCDSTPPMRDLNDEGVKVI